jgi:SAM-dependent methyltransferase
MPNTLYLRFKETLPSWLKNSLSALNQTFFARHTLQRKYGPWFDVDWRKKFRSLSDDEWKQAYDAAWRHRKNDCVEETDVALFIGGAAGCRSVLDVGCGIGTLAMAMAEQGYQVTGVDVSPEALRIAARRAGERNLKIEWVEGFAEHLPFADKAVDCITCAHTLEHVKDLDETVREFIRVARKKILVLTPKQRFKMYMDNYHTQFFDSKDKLVEVFGLSRFECLEVDCMDHQNEFQGKAWFYTGSLDS